MERYTDIDRDSGVVAYEIGDDFVRVQFHDGAVYLYTYDSAGSRNIEQMKLLAARGDSLNAFINNNVKKGYALRER